MIDFLHCLKYSGLTEPHLVNNTLPHENVEIHSAGQLSGEIPPYTIVMNVYQEIKPGMNKPKPHQTWKIDSKSVEAMDFKDKQDILYNITRYGSFEGYNPSDG